MADNLTLDPSTSIPLQQPASVTQPAAPAANPQAPPVSLDLSTSQPLTKTSTEPSSALSVPLSEGQQQEMSGLGDIFQGNFRQGVGKIYNSEIGSAHVIQGSPIEKAIRVFSPEFRGGIAPGEAEKQNHENQAALNAPLVPMSQFVDKDKHPMWKAIAESAQSLTTPANVSILASTGGLGMVDSPVALGQASKLLSAGFSAQAIGQAYTRFKEFKKAYDEGNSNEAVYQLTHAVLSGAMAVPGAAHAASELSIPTPFGPGANIETPDTTMDLARPGAQQNAVDAVSDALGKAGEAAKGAATGAGEAIVSRAKKALDLDNSLTEVLRKASPPTKGKAMEYDQKLAAAEPQLREVFQKNPDVSSPEEMTKAIDDHIGQQEGQLQAKAEQYRGTARAAMTGLDSQVTAALNKAFDAAGGQYTAGERRSAISSVIDHLSQEVGKDAEGKMMYRNPDLFEAEGARQRFNNDANPIFGSNAPPIPKAESFAKAEAAKVLRQAIDTKYDDLGVKDVKEWRQQEAPLIDVRDQIIKAQNKAIDMGEFSAWKSLTKQLGWKTLLGISAGSHAGFEGGLVGGIAANGLGVLADYLRDVKTNPNRLIQRASDMAQTGATGAKTPVNSPKLKSPATSEGIQDEPLEIPPNLRSGFTTEDILRHELGHATVAHKEGFPTEEIQSHLHPDNKGTDTVAAAITDISSLGVDPKTGLIPPGKMAANADRILSTVMGGAAADTVHRGLDLWDNKNASGDVQFAKSLLRELGVPEIAHKQIIESAHARAVGHLTDPDAKAIIEENGGVREPGLDETLHYSKERVKEILNELDRRQNESKQQGTEKSNTQLGQADDAGREGGSSPKIANRVSTGLREHTTGDEKVDAAIKEAGAIPAGSMMNLALFHDPVTGSTLARDSREVTPELIKSHLAESRLKFGIDPKLKLAAQAPEYVVKQPGVERVPGLISPGNLNLTGRPIIKNDDGSISSEYSISFTQDGHEVLVPTVVNGKFLTPDGKKPKAGSPQEKEMFKAAEDHYRKTGENLGTFDTPEHADAYANAVHNRKLVKK